MSNRQWDFLKARFEQYNMRRRMEAQRLELDDEIQKISDEPPTASPQVLLSLVMDLNERVSALEIAEAKR